MELELGLKITRTRDDVSSSIDFRFSKDPFGPLVLSRETDSRFIIIIHLKGFKKEGIEIEINEEGNRITIQGRRPVEEMVMIRWMALRKQQVDFRVFKKVFRVPYTVDLDQIKARFDDDDATLTITMPKRVKGISGFNIEEEEEEEERVDKAKVEEQSIERDESDVHSEIFEKETQKEEEFGEKESQVLGEEQKDEEETEDDDYLDKSHQIDDQDKILERLEEEKELVDSNKESEDIEGQDSHEQPRRDELDKRQQLVEAESKSDDLGSRAFEEIEEQEPDEQLDRTSESGAKEKKMTDDDGDYLRKVQGIEERERRNDERKIQDMVQGKGEDKKKVVKTEIENGDPKEDVEARMGEGFTPNIADTAMKSEDFVSDKLESDEQIDNIKELVEKKDKQGNTKVGAQSEDISLTKHQEIGEQQFQGQKRHGKQEEFKELVEEQTPEAETNIANDMPKPIQERCEGKHKIQKLFEEETKNQQEEYKEKIKEMGKMTNDAGARKFQEIIRQQELDEPARSDKESKMRELVKNIRNDEEKEEKEMAETETKVRESNRPKILREQENIQEVAEEKTNFSKNGKVKEEEEIAEKKTEFDDISRKVRDSDAMKGQEEKDMIQALVLEEKASDGGKGVTAVSEKKAENDKSKKVQEIDEQQSHEEDTCGKQFQKLIVGEVSGRGEVEDVKKTEEEKGMRDSTRKSQENEKTDSDVSGKYIKGTTIQEPDDNREIYRKKHEEEKKYDCRPEKITGTIEEELVNLNSQLEKDKVEDGEKTKEPVEEEIKDCKQEEGSEESKIKTDDDVVRKVQGIKEEEFYEPKREHVSKIEELLEEKTDDHEKEEKELAESEIKAEYSSLRKLDGSEEREKQSGQEKEEEERKTVESMTKTENENYTNVQEIMEERHEKPERHEKRFKIQEVMEAGHDDYEGEEREEKVMAKTELETKEESSKKVQKIEQQECDELKRSMLQDKMQETGEKQKTKAIEEKEILEKRAKTKDCSLRKVRDDEDPELSKPYRRQKEGKIHELVEMGTSDHREKVKKQDEDGEQINTPQLKKGEKVENIAELGEKMEGDSSGKFYESEEGKSWTQEEREKRKDLVKEEATDPKDKHTGGDHHNGYKQDEKVTAKEELKFEKDSSRKVQEIEKQEYDKLKRSMVQEKMRETEEKEKTRAMEENENVERRKKTRDGNLRKVQEGEDPELSRHMRHGEEDRIQELVETEISDHREKVKKKDILRSQDAEKLDFSELERHWEERKNHQSVEDEKGEEKIENISEAGGKMEGDSSTKFQKQKSYEDYREEEESEEARNLVKEETIDLKVKHIGGEGEQEEQERYEKVAETKTKVEDETNKKVGENKEVDSDKHERFGILDKLGGVLREGASEREKEEKNLLDDFTSDIMKKKKNEELHELEMHEKLDIVQDFMEDETGDQEDEEAEEAAAVVASNEIGRSKKFQTIEEEEEHKELKKNVETKEEVPNIRSVRETKELEAHVQELKGKTENCRDHDGERRRGEKRKQGKTVETMSRERFKTKSEEGIVGKIQETKVQESNEKKNQEGKDKIEEPDRKESSSHEVKLVSENDSLRKGQEFLEKESNVSKRGPVKQEKLQQLKKAETQDQVNEDEEQAEAETKINDGESSMNEEQKMIRKPIEEKSNALEKEVNEKFAEEWMQDKIDSRFKDKEIKGQEPYELLKHEEVDKTPEYHREDAKGIKLREIEEMMRTAEDVNLRKVQQINDALEKHRKPSEIPEKHNIQVSVKEEPQKHREQEMNEIGGYEAVLQKKSIASRESQEVEEKGSDQPKRYSEQQLMIEKDEKEEYRIREGEQKKTAKRLSQVQSKANDDSSEKNETKGHESTELRGQKKKEYHQELVEIETSDQRKEEIEEEKLVEKAERLDEYDSSKKIHGHKEEGKSDKRIEKLAEEETSYDKEAKEGNRAKAVFREVETKIGKVREVEKQEQDKKQSFVEKDTSGKAKANKNQETKSRDESSGKTQENEKPESHEQKKNEERDKKNHGSEHNEIAEAEVPRNLKGIEKQESTKMAERHENRDSIKEGQDKKSMISEVLTKAEDDESKGSEGLGKEDKSRKQGLIDNLKDEKTAKTETKSKDNESRNIHEIKEEVSNEQERLKEQGITKELVKDETHYCREEVKRETESEDGSSKKIQERDKEESIEPGRDEKRDKIQEPVDSETSEDKEEELEIEFEDEEEDWEAEVIQETDSDEDTNNIRQIKRIRLGFRLVGGSTLFMSLIVIVISFIRSKRNIRCYKF